MPPHPQQRHHESVPKKHTSTNSINKGNNMKRGKRSGSWLLRLSATALIAVVLATALLPLTTFHAAAEDDDLKIVAVEATFVPPADDEEEDPLVVETVLIADDGIIVDPEPPDDDPGIDDVIVAEEPDVEETPELGDPVALGGLQINKLWCDADYGADYATLAANCDAGGSATLPRLRLVRRGDLRGWILRD